MIPALFVGAILPATSIGITARVLGDINKLDTAEGVTILGAAVLDDVLAIIGKLVGCGAAALPTGFNARGAYRIGLGMLPRGEVSLIVAGIGLSRQLVGEVVFGVSIMMTLITTIVAPILLVPAFARGGSGRRAGGD